MATARATSGIWASMLLALAAAAAAVDIPVSDDTWVREDDPGSNRNGDGFLNARSDADADDNDVILLRFELAGSVAGTGAVLRLTWHRDQDSTGKSLALYGLEDGAAGETDWREYAVSYGNAPGLRPDGQSPGAETSAGAAPAETQDLDLDALSLLVDGQDYGPQVEGEVYAFRGAALDRFLQADTNGQVTFLILRNLDPSSNQARFCQKEARTFDSGAPVPESGAGAVLAGITLQPPTGDGDG